MSILQQLAPPVTPSNIKDGLDIIKDLIAIVAALLGGLWAWTRYVLERGLMPPSQMDLSLRSIGSSEAATLLEILIQITNRGSSALIVSDLVLRLRHIDDNDAITVVSELNQELFGRLNFPHAHVLNRIGADKRTVEKRGSNEKISLRSGEFLVVPYDTFVQPGIGQTYTFATALPRSSRYVFARASFRYQLRASKIQLHILRLSRKLGLIQYSLDHVREPHTVETYFKIAEEDKTETGDVKPPH